MNATLIESNTILRLLAANLKTGHDRVGEGDTRPCKKRGSDSPRPGPGQKTWPRAGLEGWYS